MKIKTLVAMLFLSAGATTVVAQDASNCNSNSSISHEAVRAGNFKDAYTPWKAVLENCPTLRFYTFTDGYKILKGLMAQIKDKNNPEYQKYFDELMNTHDLRMKYTEEFLAKGTKVSSADEALGIKAVDYIALAPKVDANQAYQWLSQSVNAVKGESAAATLFYFLQMSLDKLKADPNHKEQFIQDYLLASEYADAAIAAETNEAKKKNFMGIKDNLVALFVNSGTADCESLQSIYGPKVEANQTDLAYLKKVIDIMKMMRCTESEAYLQASFYAYKIEPTAEAATGCAYQAFKKGDIDGAVKFFDEAIQLETDNVKKAEKAYAAAAVLASAKKLSQARSYCQKAISFNENYGAPYILIANLYAMSPNWSDESALNKCTYFAVIDKLQRAKAVDPSVAEEANKLIGTYSGHTPQAKDLRKRSNRLLHKSISITIAFGAIVMLLSFSSCGGKKNTLGDAITERDSLPVMNTLGVTTLISDSGVTRYRVNTEEWTVYDRKKPSYWAFEKGVYLEQFDSIFNIEASIKADTAYYYDKQKLWKLIGNVDIQNRKGERFNTELLYWNEATQKVYSDKFIRIQQPDRVITGHGFDSNQQMTVYVIQNIEGIFYVDENGGTAQPEVKALPPDSTKKDSVK